MIIVSRGLCSTCYGNTVIRDKYPKAPKEVIEWCLHCKIRRVNRPRGLCMTCFSDRAVRVLYRPIGNTRGEGPEPTAAELDERITHQLENLPRWWHRGEPKGGTQSGNLE